MNEHLLRQLQRMRSWGFDVATLRNSLSDVRRVQRDRRTFEQQRLTAADGASWQMGPSFAVYGEATQAAGQASGH